MNVLFQISKSIDELKVQADMSSMGNVACNGAWGEASPAEKE